MLSKGEIIMSEALNIAKYIINKCTVDKHPISNLQLQKILYYIQREFLRKGIEPFSEQIEAWQFGPVVPVVYKKYCGFGALPIRVKYDISKKIDHTDVINPIVEEKRKLNPWDLVYDTHSQGKAWDLIYKNGIGDHQIIPIDLIKNRG